MSEDRKNLYAKVCLQSARMLVPKVSFEDENAWHIHWPKDHPHVVHAKSEKELVVQLATWLQEIGRLGNQGEHVEPEYP